MCWTYLHVLSSSVNLSKESSQSSVGDFTIAILSCTNLVPCPGMYSLSRFIPCLKTLYSNSSCPTVRMIHRPTSGRLVIAVFKFVQMLFLLQSFPSSGPSGVSLYPLPEPVLEWTGRKRGNYGGIQKFWFRSSVAVRESFATALSIPFPRRGLHRELLLNDKARRRSPLGWF